MSSKKKPQLLGPNLQMLPRVESECSSTNSDCGAKNTTEHASDDVVSTTVSMCEPSKPENTDDSVTQQAFGDPGPSQRPLRNITNQMNLGPSPCQSKESAKEEATDYELKSKKVDKLLEELSYELDKLIALSLDRHAFNLSSDEDDFDETHKGKTSSVASRKQTVIPEQLKTKQDDRILKEMGEEIPMGFGLPKTTEKKNEKNSLDNNYDPEDANKEVHNLCLEKLSNNSFEGTCRPSSTSDVVQSPQKLAETSFHSNCEAPSTSKGVPPFKSLTEAGFGNSLEPSSSLDVAQTLFKLPSSRFKAANTETDEAVSSTSDVEKKGEKEEEKEQEEEKGEEENKEEEEEKEEEKEQQEDEKVEDEEEFVKPPNWLDPRILRSVPGLKNVTNPTAPSPVDTFFGRLHQNSPLAYTGHEKEPIDKKQKDSSAVREELLQAAAQEVKKPLAESLVKESPPLNQISCPSKEKHEQNEKNEKSNALEEALKQQKTMNLRPLEGQRNQEEILVEELEKSEVKEAENDSLRDASGMKEIKASEKAQADNASPREDAFGIKDVQELIKTMDVEERRDSPPTLEMPQSQAFSPASETISANSKDSLPLRSRDYIPLTNKNTSPSTSKNSFSLSSTSKNTPASPNRNSLSSYHMASLFSQDSLRSSRKDSSPSHSKATTPSTNTGYPISLSKDSPHSHSRTSPSQSTDYLIPTHSKDSLPSHSKDTSHSLNTDSRPLNCTDFPPHSQNCVPIQEHEELVEQYDPEFPALVTPQATKELSADNLHMIRGMPTARANHMNKWLYSQSFNGNEYEHKVMEALPEYSLIQYSDDEEEAEEEAAKEQEDTVSEATENLNAMTEGLQSLQLQEAIPECCLTDAVFLVDKPKSAVSRDFKMPPMPLEHICSAKDYLKIRVTHVYTPFQFWFNFVDHFFDTAALQEIQSEMGKFYNDPHSDYHNALSSCLIKAGYICAIHLKEGWRRARISATPPPNVDSVSIYYLDYGYGADVPAVDLRYLPKILAETPALAVRGTLSHIHPLGPHWSPDSMEQFQRLIINREMFAHITELDLVERIAFLRISLTKEFVPTVNRMLVDANLAARSQHYNLGIIKNNFGRRPRYLRERLPSHEMLETRVFPVLNEEFEVAFDGIIYSPAFEKFTVPRLKKGYAALRQALVAWMPAYRKEMEERAVLYNAAKAQIMLDQREAREAWLLREKQEREKSEQERIRLTQREEMIKARLQKEKGKAEEKEMASQEEEETLKASDDEDATPQAGSMEEVD